MNDQLHAISESAPGPWQKINAVNTFITPKIDFFLKGSSMQKKRAAHSFDKQLKRAAKGWLNLPQRASPELLYLPYSKGGANIMPLADLVDTATTTHAIKMLTTLDNTVNSIAKCQLEAVVRRRIGRKLTEADLAVYLNGSLEGEFANEGGDIQSL